MDPTPAHHTLQTTIHPRQDHIGHLLPARSTHELVLQRVLAWQHTAINNTTDILWVRKQLPINKCTLPWDDDKPVPQRFRHVTTKIGLVVRHEEVTASVLACADITVQCATN